MKADYNGLPYTNKEKCMEKITMVKKQVQLSQIEAEELVDCMKSWIKAMIPINRDRARQLLATHDKLCKAFGLDPAIN